MKTMHSANSRRPKRPARRTELFVLVPDTDDTPVFTRVTEDLGHTMGDVYERRRAQRSAAGLPAVAMPKPVAVCAMRVSPEVVAFRFNRLSKVQVKTFMTEPLEIPVGALVRVEKNLPVEPLGADELVLEVLLPDPDAETTEPPKPVAVDADVLGDLFGDDNPAPQRRAPRATKAVRWTLPFTRDGGVVSFEDDAEPLERPTGPFKVAVYLRSPVVDRMLAVSYFGFLSGRPDQPETKARIAAQVLHLAAQLGEFRALAGISDVTVPTPLGRSVGAAYRVGATVLTEMPVALYRDPADLVPFAQGKVEVEVDLVASSDRLVYHLRPDATLVEHFDAFRPVAEQFVAQRVEAAVGVEQLAVARTEIILAEVTDDTVQALRLGLQAVVGGAHLTPSRWAPMD